MGGWETSRRYKANGVFRRDNGWGLCYDGERFVMTNGGSHLIFRDPVTFQELGSIQVTMDSLPILRLNELACVGRLVYANVWQSEMILRIDPETGVVLTRINAYDLLTPREEAQADVLNGIAFHPATEHQDWEAEGSVFEL